MIGGYIDPTKVQGPRLSDGMEVTANDGVANPWGFGTFSIGANVIWTDILREHKHTDDGKGSGVEQTTYSYTRSYALGICRANRNEDGTYSDILGILRATHNGKVVYNTQPDATGEQLANNAKFLKNHKFYLGGETQLPDPTIESIRGAGDASAYRGQVYMVATDEDQTDSQGSVGTWEFVVAMDGTSETVDDGLAAGRVGDFINAGFPLGDTEDKFTLVGAIKNSSGGYIGFAGNTIAEIKAHFADYMGGTRTFNNYLGFSVGSGNEIDNEWFFSGVESQPDVTNLSHLTLIYGDYSQEDINLDPFNDANCSILELNENGVYTLGGDMLKRVPTAELNVGNFPASNACPDGISICVIYPSLRILVTRKRIAPRDEAPPGSTPIPDAPGYYITPEGDVVAAPTHTPISGTFKVLSVASGLSTIDDLEQYTYFEQGPVLEFGDPDYSNQAYWEAAYDAAVDAGTLPSGWTYAADYPDTVSLVWLAEYPDDQTLFINGVPLATIVAEVCRRCGLSNTDIDVSELTEIVGGFKVASETNGEGIISALMIAFRFDCGEWDDLLRFVLRGGDVAFTIDADDFVEREGATVEETEVQEVELLRKIHVRSMDPDAGYVETTQTAERRASTVAADGEQTIQVPIVTSKTIQARIAEMRMKIAWAETRQFKTTIPYTRPELTPTDVGTITYKGRTQRIRLMEMSEDAGRIEISEAILDRQSAYTSDIEGVTHAPPVDTSPGLIGPTFGVPMNLPSLRTQDNTPGAYIGACGYLSGWRGCSVLISVDGGESFSEAMVISQPTRMGTLTEPVTATGEPIEVFMNSGQINSITDAQLAARGNAWAITSNFATLDAVSEIGQSKTATLDTGGGYDLTENVRGGLGTVAASHVSGDPFVMLSSVYFLPLDISLAGQTLYFKFVSLGTSADDAEEIPFLFNPLFTSIVVEHLTEGGDPITVNGNPIYVVTSNA